MKERAFKIGDEVYASDWCYGRIVRIDGEFADIEFEYGNGGGCLSFKLSELRRADEVVEELIDDATTRVKEQQK